MPVESLTTSSILHVLEAMLTTRLLPCFSPFSFALHCKHGEVTAWFCGWWQVPFLPSLSWLAQGCRGTSGSSPTRASTSLSFSHHQWAHTPQCLWSALTVLWAHPVLLLWVLHRSEMESEMNLNNGELSMDHSVMLQPGISGFPRPSLVHLQCWHFKMSQLTTRKQRF